MGDSSTLSLIANRAERADMNVLVTGGAGYIGSHAAKALHRAGHRPVVLDNLSTGHRWAVRWGPLAEGDLEDRSFVRRTIRSFRIEAVMHFAAHAEVAESMANPHKYLHGNVASSLGLLEEMREAGVGHIVFSSTCATYGIPQEIPIAETTPQVPVNPYGESKRFVERALEWYGLSHGFSWAALRYFNAAGADRDGEIGEGHDPESHLIPLVILAALGQQSSINVMGTDYPTPDGTAVRDFLHVDDIARAHVKALEYLMAGGASSAFNLGTGRGRSVLEVIEAVQRVSGRPVPFRRDTRRPGDPPVLIADISRARNVLGWTPRFTSLDTIVRTAFDWHVSRDVHSMAAAG
jgi:UDP-arabinose 4-epimerase